MALAKVFSALGDPVRLELVQRLISEPHQRISQVTEGLGLTRQGARRQLQVLVDADIVILEPAGREVWVDVTRESLDPVKSFISKLERQWERRLESLKQSIESE